MSSLLKHTNKMKNREKPNDVVYTPYNVAIKLIEMSEINDTDIVLDPSRGKGIFYNNLPTNNKDWCEITEGVDFFQYDKPCDVIIGNPQFSLWTDWIKHTIKLNPSKICYIIGALNLTPLRMQLLQDAGYALTKLHMVTIKDWFARTYLVVYEKNKQDIITFDRKYYHPDKDIIEL